MLARATYDAAVRRWPKARIRLCQEARIIEAAVSRIEQRGAVAFTGAGIAAVVILLIPCGGMCSRGRRGAWRIPTHQRAHRIRTAIPMGYAPSCVQKNPLETPPRNPPQESMSITRAFEEEFWPFYPRRVSKGTARKVYERVLKSKGATAEELKVGAVRYAMERAGQDPNFTKYPATWLNAESWKDESSPPIAQDGSLGMTRAGGTVTPRWHGGRRNDVRPHIPCTQCSRIDCRP